MAAALLVFASHCFLLATASGNGPLIDAGVFGRAVFFALSGFLIVKSWLDDPSPQRFVGKRLLRIMPALLVAVAFAALIIGPLATDLPLARYLGHPLTRKYLVDNSLIYPTVNQLPGVFAKNHFPTAVNDPLWTLPVEMTAYLAVLLFGVAGLVRKWWFVALGLAATVTAELWLIATASSAFVIHTPLVSALELLGYFLGGVLLYLLRGRVVLRQGLAWPLLVAALILVRTRYAALVLPLAVPYGVLTLAYLCKPRLRGLVRMGDPSYGLYVFSYPIQQFVMQITGNKLTTASLGALALPPAFILACCSWRFVEKPALRLKKFLRPSQKMQDPSPGEPFGPATGVQPANLSTAGAQP